MGKIEEMAKEKKLKVLRRLMSGDRVEISYPRGNKLLMSPFSNCVYFVDWDVTRDVIFVKKEKPVSNIVPVKIEDFTEITKLQPTR